MKYRPEIDGLRALAVAPVVLFHAGIDAFAGGFVGVDIFFVISGFLITGIILEAHAKGRFSMLHFYERRARRILPALVFVTLCSAVAAWYLMAPVAFQNFAQSVGAVSVFSSNFLFWRESGYFEQAAELKPLLHTWSLAVEEQYYVIFPIVVTLLWRFGLRRMAMVFAAVAVASLILSELGWRYAPTANFYLFPSRVWELLAGSLLAIWMRNRAQTPNDSFALLGLVLILVAIFTFDDGTPFPSLWTLIPVVGVVLVIAFTNRETRVGQLLSWRPFVGLGLISYSVYLWHFPLFVFARLEAETRGQQVEMPAMLSLCLLSVLLGWLSWRFVEQPFRAGPKPLLPSRGNVFAAAAVAGAVLLTFGIAGHVSKGNLYRYAPDRVAAWGETMSRIKPAPEDCGQDFTDMKPIACVFGDPDGKRRLIAIGDSHAHQWAGTLNAIGRQNGWRVEIYTKAECPVAEIRFDSTFLGRRYTECEQWLDRVIVENMDAGAGDVFLLTASSSGYVRGDTPRVTLQQWTDGLDASFRRLAATRARIYWLSDNPRSWEFDPLSCNFHAFINERDGGEACALVRRTALDDAIQREERALVTELPNVALIDFSDKYCGPDRCETFRDGRPLYRDNNHLSSYATAALTPDLSRALVVQ